jgi:hypothetical protein
MFSAALKFVVFVLKQTLSIILAPQEVFVVEGSRHRSWLQVAVDGAEAPTST